MQSDEVTPEMIEAGDKAWHALVVSGQKHTFQDVLETTYRAMQAARVSQEDEFLTAYVSQNGKVVGIDHPTEAAWEDVLNAHIVLRDRMNERLAEMGKCPFNPERTSSADVGDGIERAAMRASGGEK